MIVRANGLDSNLGCSILFGAIKVHLLLRLSFMKVIFNISKILKIVYLSSPTNVTKQVELISCYFTSCLDGQVGGLL